MLAPSIETKAIRMPVTFAPWIAFARLRWAKSVIAAAEVNSASVLQRADCTTITAKFVTVSQYAWSLQQLSPAPGVRRLF